MTQYATGKQTLRIDLLPENIRKKILALAARAHAEGTMTVTKRQVDYALDAVENGIRFTDGNKKGWEKTNAAIALGRVALVFFNENPTVKTQFKNHVAKMQSSGRVIERKSAATESVTP